MPTLLYFVCQRQYGEIQHSYASINAYAKPNKPGHGSTGAMARLALSDCSDGGRLYTFSSRILSITNGRNGQPKALFMK